MNTLEDRLVEYLNSLEPAVPASSLRRVDKVDIRFAQAGLSSYLNPKGAIMQPAQLPENPVSMRVRICSHVTQAKFLHIEDSLGIGKLRLFAGTYRKGNGMDVHTHHFMDVDDARVVFNALAMAEPNFTYKEYKGTAQSGGKVTSRVLSVTSKGDQVYLELKTGPGKKTPTGAVTPNGKAEVEANVAFKSYEARRLGQTVLAYIQAWDILRLMAHRNLLGKMAAYELVPTTSQNGVNGKPANGRVHPAPSTAAAAAPQQAQASGKPVAEKQRPADKPVLTNAAAPTAPTPAEKATQPPVPDSVPTPTAAATPPTPTANSQRLAVNGPLPTRPLTRRGPTSRPGLERPPTGAVATPMPKQSIAAATTSTPTPSNQSPATNGQGTSRTLPPAAAMTMAEAIYGPTAQPLRYLNGTLVDLTNKVEVQAFLRYQQEKQQTPPSRPRLRTYSQQQPAV
ncbi:MAG: hypothetical protein KA314_14870 [Chloroflexi bacterium]|nr:hypothetical protein [Chloroflexota bacterium]MBP8057117.1 hypothetical protein [Chloroflexota bacterium]